MKKFIKEIINSMQGSFMPKKVSEDQIVKEINDSLKELEFYDSKCDKRNMRDDISALNRDFNKATEEAKVKFELSL